MGFRCVANSTRVVRQSDHCHSHGGPRACLIKPAMRNEVRGYQIVGALSTKEGVFSVCGSAWCDLRDVTHFPAFARFGLPVKMHLNVAGGEELVVPILILTYQVCHQCI